MPADIPTTRLERTTRQVIVPDEPPAMAPLPRPSGRMHTVYNLPAFHLPSR